MIFCVDDSDSNNVSFYRFVIAVDGTRTGQIVKIGRMEMEQFPYVPVDVRFYY